ncbi:hypothetical protein [Streptomyces asiaticus]|uniref:hypothetical protein n=1 Tax=Streptomyces asiaticus TaxID=114695 RepID=UPI003D705DC9
MTEGHAALDTAAYSRIYEAEYARLCGYARTLTGNPWVAGDLVAEAHYSVWRRIRAGHPLGADAVPAELTGAVRALSGGVGNGGPSQQASYLEPLVQVLDELPQRWVKVLWLAEVDGLPPEEVAWRAGASPDDAAALVERVRESVRQEFLRAQPGYPASAACGGHWEGLPDHVRGTDSPHQAERIAVHIDGCRDCRGRMEQLVAADDRLSALTGPALLALYDRDMARFLAPLAAAGAVGAAGAGALVTGGGAHAAPSNGPLVSSRRSMHHLVRGQVRQAGPVAVAAAAGGVLLVAGAAVMTGLALTDGGSAAAQQPAAASEPSISDTSDSADPSSPSSPSSATSGASRHSEGSRAGVPGEASRNRPSTASVPTGHSPTDVPSSAVSPSRKAPTSASSESPSSRPSSPASSSASNDPSHRPTDEPTQKPTDGATSDPEDTPSGQPTQRPTAKPTDPGGSGSGDSRDCVSLVVRLCVSR